MKAVIQRVTEAQVAVSGKTVSQINHGILTLLGIEKGDTEEQLSKLMTKIIELRIFPDTEGKMNLSLKDVGGEHLIVSQFTLAADCSKGRRPAFTTAERPDIAREMYEKAIVMSGALGVNTLGGVFQADMKVTLTNDGPVTFVLS
jgi:D-tyrosyl-tRNA(Tyr) deacylase